VRCALVMGSPHDWLPTVALASPSLNFSALPKLPNPFGLPEDERPDVIMLVANNTTYDRLVDDPGYVRKLERYAPVVGLDGADWFELAFPPEIVEGLSLVIKGQGIYRDRELYNYRVGSWSVRGNWTEKLTARERTYRPADLEKLRLSVPCFAADLPPIRRRTRQREGGPGRSRERPMSRAEGLARNQAERLLSLSVRLPLGRSHDVHRVYSLTHIQRREALRRLDGLGGATGLSSIPAYTIGSTSTPEALRAELRPLMREPVGRLRYLFNLRRHKIAVAPVGFGEVTFRHAEAWRTGTALVSQSLDHVDVMFPLKDHENVAYCRPDLSDLREVVHQLLANDELRRRIAIQGQSDYLSWARDWRQLLSDGIERHLYGLLRPPPSKTSEIAATSSRRSR
jgi:Glycosyl transferases group 1